MTDDELKQLLTETHTIAVVGHSAKPTRDSYKIGAYLRAEGYRVFPVNPNISEVLGQRAFAALADVPEPIDLVDVFRANEHVPGVVAAALAVKAKAIWTQMGVNLTDSDRALLAEAGVKVVENQCIRINHQRLFAHRRS